MFICCAMNVYDSLANKSDTAKHWPWVSPRIHCLVVPLVRSSQAFAKFAMAS